MENQLFDLMTKMYNEMQEVKTKVNSMESKIGGMDSEIKGMKQNMATKDDIKDIRQDIVRLENKMDDKISVLFDSREVQSDNISKVEKAVFSIQTDIASIKQDVAIIANKESETEKDVLSIKNHLKVVKQVYENM